ncbi:hypothetical protein KCU61_g116, partial [Aureobasidium melanogenum]
MRTNLRIAASLDADLLFASADYRRALQMLCSEKSKKSVFHIILLGRLDRVLTPLGQFSFGTAGCQGQTTRQ